MAQYSELVGKRVELHYRASHLYLLVNGTLVADSGRSIFLEEHYPHQGSVKTFRWEVPYPCIVSLDESYSPPEPLTSVVSADAPELAHAVPRRLSVKHLPEKA